MAISKLLTIGASGRGYVGKYLKQSINYILNPDKTDRGILIGACNCQPEYAYDKMMLTKEFFEQTGKRQGYHIVISFAKGETDAATAYDIVNKFVTEYLGGSYEAVFAVHDNTEAIHGHIVFNSVSYMDGRKYRYERGDWKRYIQPLVNSLCEKRGLSTIDVNVPGQRRSRIPELTGDTNGLSIWKQMIRRDIDAAVVLTDSYPEFLRELARRGYELKTGKYLAVRPPGMERFRRLKSLGEDYSEERIRERIQVENVSTYRSEERNPAPAIRHVKSTKHHRWHRTLTPLQKYYVARMYKLGLIRKRPYSRVYQYKDDIKGYKLLREKSLFLLRHNIEDIAALVNGAQTLEGVARRIQADKRKAYRELKAYSDTEKMLADGYSLEEIEALVSHTNEKLVSLRAQDGAVRKSLGIANLILEELKNAEPARDKAIEQEREEEKERTKVRSR